MTKEIDPLDFANDVLDQERRDTAIRQHDPGSKLTFFPAWCRHQDGKIIRPLVWHRPGVREWERRSIEIHQRQKEEADRFSEERDERIRRERVAERESIFIGNGTDVENPTARKRSQSGQHELDVIVM